MANDDTDRLLTVAEAAGRMSVAESYVRRLIFEKRIPVTKFGASRNSPVRIKESDIVDFLEACRIEASR